MSITHSPTPAGHLPVSNYSSAQLATEDVVMSSPVIVKEIRLTNAAAGLRYPQFFDAAAVPADGAVPTLLPIPVAANETVSYSFPDGGRYFAEGFCWCSSTTQATKTVSAGNDLWIEVDFVKAN